jgi:hypothetical protein
MPRSLRQKRFIGAATLVECLRSDLGKRLDPLVRNSALNALEHVVNAEDMVE